MHPLSFGPPILNALAKVASILGRALSPPAPSPSPLPSAPPLIPAVPAPRVLSPVPSPRVPIPHLVESLQHHDPTIAGKTYNSVTGRAETIDSLLQGPDRPIWLNSLTNEWARCTTGLSKNRTPSTRILGNRTMFLIRPDQVPADCKVTYATFVCSMRPGKSEPYRIRMAVGGDRLDAFQDVRSPAVGIVDTKLHINSTISDCKRGARYCTGDLKDFFLGSDMKIFQYMRIHRRSITQEILDEHDLTEAHFDSKGYCYLEILKGMYGLKEAAILAYE